VGLAPTGKAPPYHGAHPHRTVSYFFSYVELVSQVYISVSEFNSNSVVLGQALFSPLEILI